MVDQGLDYFRVDEVQQPRAHVDQRDAHAERREHARVLAPDHARADHRERARQLVELHHVVAGEDVGAIERGALVARRMGADGQHDIGGADASLHAAQFVIELQHVLIDEARARSRQLDAVAQKLMAQYVDLVTHDRIDAHQQVLESDFFLDPVRIAVDCVFAIAGQVEDGLAHRLARNRADVDADAAEDRLALDHDDALAQLGALDSGVMSGWPGAYDREIEIKSRHRIDFRCFVHLK